MRRRSCVVRAAIVRLIWLLIIAPCCIARCRNTRRRERQARPDAKLCHCASAEVSANDGQATIRTVGNQTRFWMELTPLERMPQRAVTHASQPV